RRFAEHTNRKFVRLFRQFEPAAVLCTHFLPLEVLGSLKGRYVARFPFTTCVITDFEAHALWMEPVVDLYCVAADETKARLVARRNIELRRELGAQDRRHPTHVLGFVTNMHECMAVADLIITKPGGLTSAEALALGKPLLILSPIPGQEMANSDFLLERGAA